MNMEGCLRRIGVFVRFSKFIPGVSMSTSFSTPSHYNVLIVGGGCGGCAVGSIMSKRLKDAKIAIVDGAQYHAYQPMWTLVGAGIRRLNESMKPMSEVVPRSVDFIPDEMINLKPESSRVFLKSGKEVTYDYLVLALGLSLRYDMIDGAIAALEKDPRVCSNYSANYVEKTFKAYQSFTGGHAVFTLPAGPIKCAGAPQKVMYLFEEYLRKHGHREATEISYFTSLPKMFSVDKYADSLKEICRNRGIKTNHQYNLIKVDAVKSEAVFKHLQTKECRTVKYDMLHITPPMSVPNVLKGIPRLTNAEMGDYVDVDKATLRHKTFPNIFALGDCAAIPTSKTAAAISVQSSILTKNLLDVVSGGEGRVAKYDGYTACPLVTGYSKGILAEFDYSNQPLETFPLDQGRERYFFYFFKAQMMPKLYWDWLLRGLWTGPKKIRKLLHFGFSK